MRRNPRPPSGVRRFFLPAPLGRCGAHGADAHPRPTQKAGRPIGAAERPGPRGQQEGSGGGPRQSAGREVGGPGLRLLGSSEDYDYWGRITTTIVDNWGNRRTATLFPGSKRTICLVNGRVAEHRNSLLAGQHRPRKKESFFLCYSRSTR